MRTADFDYALPVEQIAQQPASERTLARMLVVRRATGALEHRRVNDLPEYLQNGDLLVVNDTQVIPARLWGVKPETGGKVEVLLIEESAPGVWECLLRMRRPRSGMVFKLASGRIQAEVLAVHGAGRVSLRLGHTGALHDILEAEGAPPLPPYIKRRQSGEAWRNSDCARYQTVYARHPGAVAAPTAGLHFTEALLAGLGQRGVRRAAVTLHVGPGTFKPVTAEELERHKMESERYVVPQSAAHEINAVRRAGGRILAVGSTVVRTLETVAGADGSMTASAGRSALFIYPPYKFRVVDLLLTNFHLPRSSLLMMVSAFAGCELVRRAYREAVDQKYRFYSYGDCMLII